MMSEPQGKQTITKPPPHRTYARYEIAPGIEAELGWLDPETLKPVDWNPRRITSGARERLGKVLARFGVVETLVIRGETNEILGGHQRRDLVLDLAINECRPVPVSRIFGLSDADAVILNNALNESDAQGDMDKVQQAQNFMILMGLVNEGKLGTVDLEATGASRSSIDETLAKWSESVSDQEPKEHDEAIADELRVECPSCHHRFIP